MQNLLLNKSFDIKEYKVDVNDGNNVIKEVRYRVLFSKICIAQGFDTLAAAENYIDNRKEYALWNALWTKGFACSWGDSLKITG